MNDHIYFGIINQNFSLWFINQTHHAATAVRRNWFLLVAITFAVTSPAYYYSDRDSSSPYLNYNFMGITTRSYFDFSHACLVPHSAKSETLLPLIPPPQQTSYTFCLMLSGTFWKRSFALGGWHSQIDLEKQLPFIYYTKHGRNIKTTVFALKTLIQARTFWVFIVLDVAIVKCDSNGLTNLFEIFNVGL
jgi:hypothetical protein